MGYVAYITLQIIRSSSFSVVVFKFCDSSLCNWSHMLNLANNTRTCFCVVVTLVNRLRVNSLVLSMLSVSEKTLVITAARVTGTELSLKTVHCITGLGILQLIG